jgi:hypothetical protein
MLPNLRVRRPRLVNVKLAATGHGCDLPGGRGKAGEAAPSVEFQRHIINAAPSQALTGRRHSSSERYRTTGASTSRKGFNLSPSLVGGDMACTESMVERRLHYSRRSTGRCPTGANCVVVRGIEFAGLPVGDVTDSRRRIPYGL